MSSRVVLFVLLAGMLISGLACDDNGAPRNGSRDAGRHDGRLSDGDKRIRIGDVPIGEPRNPAAGSKGALAAGSTLRGVRTIEKCPFSDEPGVYDFGGYTAGIVEPMHSNTAWIDKGRLSLPGKETVKAP